ncbi:MAG TPA: hypothetical protein VKJ01_07185, partial [Candidatus Solibacter sp.]|nr:hypothetical protein [Candidatus Solibacter sp.]
PIGTVAAPIQSRDRQEAVAVTALTALFLMPWAAMGQPGLARDGDRWVRVFSGSAPAGQRLRVNAHGPVTFQGGTFQGSAANRLQYTVRVSVMARTEAQAQRVLERYAVRVSPVGGWTVLTAPGGPVVSTVTVKAPWLSAVEISTSDGPVEAAGVNGPLTVDTGAGELSIDRIRGDCKAVTGGGDIRVGQVNGSLHCSSGAGRISVGTVSGEAVMETVGGDILANDIGASVRAQTGAGGVHILKAGGPVTAGTGGGQIVVDKANGIVMARNMAGPVQVGAAAGVQCESGSGGIRVSNITGAMRVSTSLGNIMASLLAGRLADSFLATGNGDITVWIPSNVGVMVRARNEMADSMRRIVSEYPGLQPRRQGRQLFAEGPVNGGGPLLQISATAGTIFIKKQR